MESDKDGCTMALPLTLLLLLSPPLLAFLSNDRCLASPLLKRPPSGGVAVKANDDAFLFSVPLV